MFRSRKYFFLKKRILIPLLLMICSYQTLSVAQEFNLANKSIEQSILSRYMQLIITSYDYYQEKLGFSETEDISRIQNFPVLLGNNDNIYSQEGFHTERFFSKLHQHRVKTKKTVIKTQNEPKTKVIRISNIPVNNGFLSSYFGFRKDPMHGSRRLHKGIDIAAKYGSSVNPLGEGLVMFAGYKSGYGNMVELKHGNSVLTRYAHLKKYLVDVGQQVNVGDEIGLIGSTGRSTGPHLHLEVLINGEQVDPQIFLANHFGSRTSTQIASRTRTKDKNNITPLTSDKEIPEVKNFPQVSYLDYVKSVDGMFGFSAPEAFSR